MEYTSVSDILSSEEYGRLPADDNGWRADPGPPSSRYVTRYCGTALLRGYRAATCSRG